MPASSTRSNMRRRSAESGKSTHSSAASIWRRRPMTTAPDYGRAEEVRSRARLADALQRPELHRSGEAGDARKAGAVHDGQPLQFHRVGGEEPHQWQGYNKSAIWAYLLQSLPIKRGEDQQWGASGRVPAAEASRRSRVQSGDLRGRGATVETRRQRPFVQPKTSHPAGPAVF